MNSETQFDATWDRISQLTGWKSYGELASFIGITAPSVSGAKKRGTMPPDWLIKVANGYQSSVEWLATGQGPMKRGDAAAGGLDQDEYALVPRYNVEVSAGGGTLVESEAVIGTMAFRREWLKRSGLELAKLVLVTAKGDSMVPTFADGDILLVDLRQTEIVDGAVHVIRNDGHLLAKRLQLGMGDQVIVRSDNAIYSALETTRGALNIVGRVVWRGGRM